MSKRVLVVDDEELVRQLACQILDSHGFAVVAASDANEALSLVEAHDGFDLLLTDVLMPGKNGDQLARELTYLFPELPIVYMSGYSSASALQEELSSGKAHFIAKPFRAADLIKKIAAVLGL